MLEKDSATRRNLDEFLASQGIGITPELELESIDLLVEFARIGLGIAHVLKESAVTPIKNGELFKINTETSLPKRMLGIALMKNMPLSRSSSEFISLLKNNSFPQ